MSVNCNTLRPGKRRKRCKRRHRRKQANGLAGIVGSEAGTPKAGVNLGELVGVDALDGVNLGIDLNVGSDGISGGVEVIDLPDLAMAGARPVDVQGLRRPRSPRPQGPSVTTAAMALGAAVLGFLGLRKLKVI